MPETDATMARITAGENLRADIQQALHSALVDWAQHEIATRLGWSDAKMSALFACDGDPSMGDIAELAWAVGCEPDMKMSRSVSAPGGSDDPAR